MERLPRGRKLDGLAEGHHRAPHFRPLAFLAFFTCSRCRSRFVLPEYAPGGLHFPAFPDRYRICSIPAVVLIFRVIHGGRSHIGHEMKASAHDPSGLRVCHSNVSRSLTASSLTFPSADGEPFARLLPMAPSHDIDYRPIKGLMRRVHVYG